MNLYKWKEDETEKNYPPLEKRKTKGNNHTT